MILPLRVPENQRSLPIAKEIPVSSVLTTLVILSGVSVLATLRHATAVQAE